MQGTAKKIFISSLKSSLIVGVVTFTVRTIFDCIRGKSFNQAAKQNGMITIGTTIGSLIGASIGTIIFPKIGTTIGLVVGGVFGLWVMDNFYM